jgi:gamma-glutamylaminecyclotransferase
MLPRVLLFVYGSLKAGYENAHLLAGAMSLGAVRTAPGYRLLSYFEGYPGFVRAPGSSESVAGELYEVDAELLAELDAFEDCPTLYERVSIELEDRRVVQAYIVPAGSESGWPLLERY